MFLLCKKAREHLDVSAIRVLSYFDLLMTVLLNNVCIAGTGTWTSQQIEVAVRQEGCHKAEGPFSDKSRGRPAFSYKPSCRDTFSYKPHGRDTFSDKSHGRQAKTLLRVLTASQAFRKALLKGHAKVTGLQIGASERP